MENIVWLDQNTLIRLYEAATRADAQGRSFRVCTGRDSTGAWVKWDVGNTGWTPPYYSAGF